MRTVVGVEWFSVHWSAKGLSDLLLGWSAKGVAELLCPGVGFDAGVGGGAEHAGFGIDGDGGVGAEGPGAGGLEFVTFGLERFLDGFGNAGLDG